MNKRNVSKEFLNAIDLVANPETWTRLHFATTNKGVPIAPKAPEACKWCASGALQKTGVLAHEQTAFNRFVRNYAGESIPAVNDFHGREAILSLMEEFAGVHPSQSQD